jgi:hypothetical protein
MLPPIFITKVSDMPYVNVVVTGESPVPAHTGAVDMAPASSATKDAKRPSHLRLIR